MFSSKEISSRVNTNILSGTVICLLLFFTLCTLSFCFAMRNSLNSGMKKKLTRDVNISYEFYDDVVDKYLEEAQGETRDDKIQSVLFDGGGIEIFKNHYDEEKENSIDKRLKEKNVDNAFKDVTEAWTYIIPNYYMYEYIKEDPNLDLQENSAEMMSAKRTVEQFITVSDYNKMAKAHNHEEYSLNDDEYIMVCNYDLIKDIKDKCLKNNTPLKIGDKTYKPKYSECVDCGMDMNPQDTTMGIIIVPDSVDMTKMYKYIDNMVASYNDDFSIDSEYKSVEEYISDKEFTKMVTDYDGDLRFHFKVNTNKSLRQDIVGLSFIIIFIGLYIGIIFMIVSAAILALKTLTDATDNSGKYSILRRIGVKEKMINRSLSVQNFLFFGLPVALATIHSVFGIKFIKSFAKSAGMKVSGESITRGVVFMLVIYGIYFLVTNFTSKKIISERV